MSDEIDNPVRPWRITIAKGHALENVDQAAIACRTAGIPFYAACALLEKESMGKNVWGNDKVSGQFKTEFGVFSGYPHPVTQQAYLLFRHEVIRHGKMSNGVGPTQITWPGFFTDMEKKNLRPWVVSDNMEYGFGILAWLREEEGTWEAAGSRYNGSTAYGRDFIAKLIEWWRRFNIKGPVPR